MYADDAQSRHNVALVPWIEETGWIVADVAIVHMPGQR